MSLPNLCKLFLDFDPDFIRSKSGAAAGLCSWVINVCKFYEVFCEVEPKRRALNDANQMLQDAQTRLSNLVSKVAQLEETLADLTRRYTVRKGPSQRGSWKMMRGIVLPFYFGYQLDKYKLRLLWKQK